MSSARVRIVEVLLSIWISQIIPPVRPMEKQRRFATTCVSCVVWRVIGQLCERRIDALLAMCVRFGVCAYACVRVSACAGGLGISRLLSGTHALDGLHCS